jgi:mono/diheme cytochrome c family protein
MRKALLAIALTGVFAITLSAQDDAAYQGYMMTVQTNFGPLRMAMDNDAAKGPATALADVFGKVAAYWKAKGVADAVGFAETAQTAAKDIAAGKGDLAANKMTIQGTCASCHMAHRGGGRGAFTIK